MRKVKWTPGHCGKRNRCGYLSPGPCSGAHDLRKVHSRSNFQGEASAVVVLAQHAPPRGTYGGPLYTLLWVPKLLLVVLITTFHYFVHTSPLCFARNHAPGTSPLGHIHTLQSGCHGLCSVPGHAWRTQTTGKGDPNNGDANPATNPATHTNIARGL